MVVHRIVGLNVQSAQNAQETKLASIKNARIHVQVFAVKMQIVASIITVLYAYVQMDLQGIHSLDVIQFHHHHNLFHRMKFVIHAIQHHVVHFQIAEILIICHHAHVCQII